MKGTSGYERKFLLRQGPWAAMTHLEAPSHSTTPDGRPVQKVHAVLSSPRQLLISTFTMSDIPSSNNPTASRRGSYTSTTTMSSTGDAEFHHRSDIPHRSAANTPESDESATVSREPASSSASTTSRLPISDNRDQRRRGFSDGVDGCHESNMPCRSAENVPGSHDSTFTRRPRH